MSDVDLNWDLEDIARSIGGRLIGRSDHPIREVVTDSRTDVAGNLFVAISGEHFDGHSYVQDVLERGAVGVVVNARADVAVEPRIEVDSTGDALLSLAIKRRDELHIPVIAITGSTGKTSTKDLLAAGLPGAWASPRSFNNEIGVPLTILSTPPDAIALVVEVGSRGRGHIEWLAPAVRPDVAILTNLGVVHLETFGSREGLADAKYELVEALGPDGTAVLPFDEPALARPGINRRISFGPPGADVEVSDVVLDTQGLPSFVLTCQMGRYEITLPIAGRHNALNAASAVGAALALDLDVEAFCGRLSGVQGSDWRMEIHSGRYTVVNDAYNANPQSMASALETVASMGERCIAVLGAMAELGPVCEEEHLAAGRDARTLGFDELIVVGPDHGYAPGFGNGARKATDIEDAADTLSDIIQPGDVVLVKASRSAGLERLAHHLIEDSAS